VTKEELIRKLKDKESFILAIDGKCGSGKSTLAKELQLLFNANVFHMDDFYLPVDKRTLERLSMPGGNVEYERFLSTVLLPLIEGEDVVYQRFDCSTMSYVEGEIIEYKPYNIIEGSYSLRPELVGYYTDIIVLDIDDELQINRLIKRNPLKIDAFKEKWIPLENQYFEYYNIMNNFPVLKIKE